MKIRLLTLSLTVVFLPLLSLGQSFWSVSSKFFLHDVAPYVQNTQGVEIPEKLQQKYALQYRNGNYYIGAIALIDPENTNLDLLKADGIEINAKFNHIITLQVPVQLAHKLEQYPGLRHVDMGASEEPTVDKAIADTHLDSAKAGLGLPRAVSGKGVIVAVIDWGFDFTHPNFYDTSMTDLRIKRVWDQNQVAGTPPSGYSYGSEYATTADILAAEHDDPYTFGLGSHGTHTTGIAAGGGAGTSFKGVAHEADIVMIPYLRQASSLLDALNYVKDFAAQEGKPFVFNMSTGSHLGPHDGTSLKNQAISQTVGEGKVFVGSAGNNGQRAFHLMHHFVNNETISSEGESPFALTPDAWGQTFVIWGSPNQPVTASFSLVTATGDTMWTSTMFDSPDEPAADTAFLVGNDTLAYRIQSIAQDPSNNKPNIRIEVRNLTGHRVALHLKAQQGRVDVWHNVRLDLRYTNWGLAWNGRGRANWIDGDVDYGVGEPAGVGPDVISVGAYRSVEIAGNGFQLYGDIAPFSSFGPTVDGRVKPDITAPGVVVASSVSSFDPSVGSVVSPVSFNGKTYGFLRYSGTSMSGPVVCGTVALMLEANPYLSANEIREIIRSTARQDDKTGTLPATGHNRWGWGKLDAWSAVFEAFESISVKNYQKPESLNLYPNPARESVQVKIPEGQTKRVTTTITNALGIVEARENIEINGSTTLNIDVSNLPRGVYIISIGDGMKELGSARVILQ